MKAVRRERQTEWVLQAYIAANPRHPRWGDVDLTAIEGWETYHRRNGTTLWRDPRLVRHFDGWRFMSRDAAREVLGELLKLPQKYHLRVIERRTYLDTDMIAGADIEDGVAAMLVGIPPFL